MKDLTHLQKTIPENPIWSRAQVVGYLPYRPEDGYWAVFIPLDDDQYPLSGMGHYFVQGTKQECEDFIAEKMKS